MWAKWERMWRRSDNQDVGLEAAIIQRKRNSSLVKRLRADNSTGLKPTTEAADSDTACRDGVVGEHSMGSEVGSREPMDRMEETLPA